MNFFRACFLYSAWIGSLLICPSFALSKVWDAHAIMDHQSYNMCALTFDDGPSDYTGQLLDSLKEEKTPATFVVLGMQAERRPELIKRMLKEGHEVVSHGYAHPNLRLISHDEAYYDIKKSHDILLKLGAKPKFFRPPYGKYNRDIIALAQKFDMSILMWSVDSNDWRRRPDYGNMPNILERPMTAEEMRGVFLFHDTKVRTVNDIKLIITILRAVGCTRFVTVSDYFNDMPLDELQKQEPIMAHRPDLQAKDDYDYNKKLVLSGLKYGSLAIKQKEQVEKNKIAVTDEIILTPKKVKRDSYMIFQPSLK